MTAESSLPVWGQCTFEYQPLENEERESCCGLPERIWTDNLASQMLSQRLWPLPRRGSSVCAGGCSGNGVYATGWAFSSRVSRVRVNHLARGRVSNLAVSRFVQGFQVTSLSLFAHTV